MGGGNACHRWIEKKYFIILIGLLSNFVDKCCLFLKGNFPNIKKGLLPPIPFSKLFSKTNLECDKRLGKVCSPMLASWATW